MTNFGLKPDRPLSSVSKQIFFSLIAVSVMAVAVAIMRSSQLPYVMLLLGTAYAVGVVSRRRTVIDDVKSSDAIAEKGAVVAQSPGKNQENQEKAAVVKRDLDEAGKNKIRSLVKRNHELLVLYSLANVVASSLELSEVLSVALDGVAKIFGARAGEIGIIGEPEETVVIYYRGASILVKYHGPSAPRLSRRLTSEAVKTGKPVIAQLNEADGVREDKNVKVKGVSKVAVFPIISKRHTLGTITLACSSSCNLDKTDQELLMSIGTMIGSAIENSQLYQKLKRISDTDPVTGLYNHRFIIKRLNAEIRRASRYGHAVSVLMMDVDGFKEVNDSHGHMFGDTALKKIALATVAACRETDVIGRYGGDEFLMVLPETEVDAAVTVSNRIRRYIQNISLMPSGSDKFVTITASLGLAVYPISGKNGTDLIIAADKNLYLSKRAGGNQLTSRQVA